MRTYRGQVIAFLEDRDALGSRVVVQRRPGLAHIFVQQFEQTMLNRDRDDPNSLHIHLVAQGLSRQKIDPDTLPVFTENLSATTLLQHAVVDVIGLFFSEFPSVRLGIPVSCRR